MIASFGEFRNPTIRSKLRIKPAARVKNSPNQTRDQPETDGARDTSRASAHGLPITRLDRTRLIEGIRFLWPPGDDAGRESALRFTEFAAARGLDLDMAWACENPDGTLRPCCVVVPNPGRTALVFVSDLTDHRKAGSITHLMNHIVPCIDSKRVRVAQVLLSQFDRRSVGLFESAGFERLASLDYMERPCQSSSRINNSRKLPAGFTAEGFLESNRGAFEVALGASYEDTLDCPRLCGLRSVEDAVRGHQAAGKFDPDLWTLVRSPSGDPAAILLLSPIPEQLMVELTYLGVGKAFRGLGLGAHLVELGVRTTEARTESRITLAVDQQNKPAVRLYRQFGFSRVDRRTALICPIPRANRQSLD